MLSNRIELSETDNYLYLCKVHVHLKGPRHNLRHEFKFHILYV